MSAIDDCLDMHKTKDYSEWIKLYQEAREELAALRARVAELEAAQAAALTPRKCGTCQQAAEQMREAAAKLIEGKRLTQNEIDEGIIWADNCTDKFAEYIRAMPLPTCGDCNPLAPSMPVDELHGVKCQCWCECDNYASRNIEGVLLCDKCADDE